MVRVWPRSVPEMFAFPVLEDVWGTIAKRSSFKLCCNRCGMQPAGLLCRFAHACCPSTSPQPRPY
jgi:hypothetical protein